MSRRSLAIGLIGHGRIGALVEEVAAAEGHRIAWKVTRANSGWDAPADVAIDFSHADWVPETVQNALRSETPLIIGTTGWGSVRDELRRSVKQDGRIGILEAPNLAPGVNWLRRVVSECGRFVVQDPDNAAVWIEERHHAKKVDSPSGTALELRDMVVAGQAGGLESIPIASVRAGSTPGEHRVCIETADESIEIVHRARSRRVFAAGAVRAAEWIIGRRGWLTLDEWVEGSAVR